MKTKIFLLKYHPFNSRLATCELTEISCSYLVAALRFNLSHLRELDLSRNSNLQDSGVHALCAELDNPQGSLEILRSDIKFLVVASDII